MLELQYVSKTEDVCLFQLLLHKCEVFKAEPNNAQNTGLEWKMFLS